MTVLTVGHSTRSAEELVAMLRAHGATVLVDVRRFPASRRYPHFNGPVLARALAAQAVGYVHEVDLGGHREPRPASVNLGWGVAAFRGYADHMETPAFQAALQRVIDLAAAGRPVVMCAEADPSRCHRQLLADALLARGIEVQHVLGACAPLPHVLNPMAEVTAARGVRYPAPPSRKRRQGRLFGADD
jgi:uncharacterized protein (DUF488 family)